MVRLLELTTGLSGFSLRAGSEAFSLVLQAPAQARPQDLRLRRVVRIMKPAAVRFEGTHYSEPEGGSNAG